MRLILSASAFNAVPGLNSDHGPGMPAAARKVQ
jgi:hypothetical protein